MNVTQRSGTSEKARIQPGVAGLLLALGLRKEFQLDQ